LATGNETDHPAKPSVVNDIRWLHVICNKAANGFWFYLDKRSAVNSLHREVIVS